jgi:hypothetical protein
MNAENEITCSLDIIYRMQCDWWWRCSANSPMKKITRRLDYLNKQVIINSCLERMKQTMTVMVMMVIGLVDPMYNHFAEFKEQRNAQAWPHLLILVLFLCCAWHFLG